MIIFKAAERKVSKFVNRGGRTSDKLARLKYNYTLLLNMSCRYEFNLHKSGTGPEF